MKKSAFWLLLVALSFGCETESEPSAPESDETVETGGKGDTFAPCKADEPLLVCMVDECPNLTGDDFDDCFDTSTCIDASAAASDACTDCVVEGFDRDLDAAGIASSCADSGIDVGCEADEPVLNCINDQCPGITGDDFDLCFEQNCEADATDTPVACGLCLVSGFEGGLDAAEITAECTGTAGPAMPADLTGVACSTGDQQLFTCLNDECPDADTSEAVGQCIADSCVDAAQATAVACIVCVDTELSAGTADVQTACTAADSSPCTIAVATDLAECANGVCAGRQGDALDECMDNECPEVFDGVSEGCGNCVIGLNQNGVPLADAAGHCAGG